MKVVVAGGTGQTGKLLVEALRARGHEVVPASPSTGVDAITGAGLAESLAGAGVVVDVTNPPVPETAADFFRTMSENLTAAERAAGVGHHVVLSIVGLEPAGALPYYQAKLAQEAAVHGGGVAYTIVRATQFFEFLGAVLDSGACGDDVQVQPIALSDLVEFLVEIVEGEPAGTVEVAGPEVFTLGEAARRLGRDGHRPGGGWMGVDIPANALVAGPGARRGPTTLADWTE